MDRPGDDFPARGLISLESLDRLPCYFGGVPGGPSFPPKRRLQLMPLFESEETQVRRFTATRLNVP